MVDRLRAYERYFKRINKRNDLDSTTRLQELERLEGLMRLQSLQSLQSDYQDVKTPDGALLYCDIPYKFTNGGKYTQFDHERFYKWARQQDNIYISEYQMPDDFIEVASIEKKVLSAANSNSLTNTEKIFTNQRTYDALPPDRKEVIAINKGKQVNLFDLI